MFIIAVCVLFLSYDSPKNKRLYGKVQIVSRFP